MSLEESCRPGDGVSLPPLTMDSVKEEHDTVPWTLRGLMRGGLGRTAADLSMTREDVHWPPWNPGGTISLRKDATSLKLGEDSSLDIERYFSGTRRRFLLWNPEKQYTPHPRPLAGRPHCDIHDEANGAVIVLSRACKRVSGRGVGVDLFPLADRTGWVDRDAREPMPCRVRRG